MEAFIVVKEHPHFSGTDGRGDYRLNGVPLGRHRVQVWHPEFGSREATVELVRDGQVLDIDFDLKKKGEMRSGARSTKLRKITTRSGAVGLLQLRVAAAV